MSIFSPMVRMAKRMKQQNNKVQETSIRWSFTALAGNEIPKKTTSETAR